MTLLIKPETSNVQLLLEKFSNLFLFLSHNIIRFDYYNFITFVMFWIIFPILHISLFTEKPYNSFNTANSLWIHLRSDWIIINILFGEKLIWFTLFYAVSEVNLSDFTIILTFQLLELMIFCVTHQEGI